MLRNRKATDSNPKAIPFADCPAKSFETSTGKVVGRSVENHCRIVGEVAREILNRLPQKFREEQFPEGSVFAVATHDIGKVSPTFYNKIMRACEAVQIPGFNPDLEREWGGHAGVSQLTAKFLGAPEYLPEILGQHHGFSPPVSGMRADDEKFGGNAWQAERQRLVSALQNALGENWPKIKSVGQARLLAGLTSVADWVGSGSHFEDPQTRWEETISEALDDAGFVPVTFKEDLSFEQIFGFSPRESQSVFIDQVSEPGVYVLEAPMGLGKTEAALYAAYKLLAAGQARGIYFALPTQMTSNKIFERFERFLGTVLGDDCKHRSLLLHANAWLFETEMGEEGRPGGAWFNHSKRGLLAPFAVGTIDQALMAAMNVKHGFVRAFGLAGKVVILDEVHTYDAYTGTILDALVSLLRELQCTVIILSATLNQERRQQLVGTQIASTDYPLVTSVPGEFGKVVREISVSANEKRQIQVSLHSDEVRVVEQVLARAEQGQQVLWIENTVKEAQQRFLDLAARATEIGAACGLLHSRFTANDRQRIEDRWVNLYGKSGWSQRHIQGRILIGTQVLEQSLDIDADFMVSKFAPTDMLLQRLGRLWRHDDAPRNEKATPDAWLLAPTLDESIDSPQQHFGSSSFVYSPYVLCRSLEVWQDLESIKLPDDIRSLIERTYAIRKESGAMNRWLSELDEGNSRRRGRNAMRQLARVALSEGGNTLPESKAQTRYSEADNYEVLLLRAMSRNRAGDTATLTLLTGEVVDVPLQRNRLTSKEWRQRSATLMRQIVAVRINDAPKPLPLETLERFGLQHCFFLGSADWSQDESVLRVALVDDAYRLRGIEYYDVHDTHVLEYRDDLGYRLIKS